MRGHFLDEMEVATTAIGEATILQIKTTVALPFQSSLTMLVVQWWQRNLPKSVLHVQGFSLLISLRRRYGTLSSLEGSCVTTQKTY